MKPLKPFYKAIYYVLLVLLQGLIRLVFRIKVNGRENLVTGSGYVLGPNHISAIDPLFVLAARGIKPKMLIMGKEELFDKNPFLNFFWAVAGVFPIDRGTGDRDTVEHAMDQVRNGCGLLIFPEGTRSKSGSLGRVKSGAFVVAMEAGVPIIPCRIQYKAGRAKVFTGVTVSFGKPLSIEEMGLDGEYSIKKIKHAKQLYIERLESLGEQHAKRIG